MIFHDIQNKSKKVLKSYVSCFGLFGSMNQPTCALWSTTIVMLGKNGHSLGLKLNPRVRGLCNHYKGLHMEYMAYIFDI
jgi:hypothetical protein